MVFREFPRMLFIITWPNGTASLIVSLLFSIDAQTLHLKHGANTISASETRP